jgi:murein DD-endopeptidase MepM/ murein hydrolase activator NlpD
MTFAEAGLLPPPPAPSDAASPPEPDQPPVPPVPVAAPEAEPSEPPEGPPIDPALVRFAAEARGRRYRARPGTGFPPEADAAWRSLVTDLDAYLALALPQTPLLELVRARVTLEAEWEYDRRRYGPPPRELASLVEARGRRLAVRIRTSRVLGHSMFARRRPARLRWPILDAGLSSPFGRRVHPFSGEVQLHAGIDLAAPPGRVVASAAAGYVVRSGWTRGYGLMVELRHQGDVTTRYSHLSAVLCAPGNAVDAGQPLGLVGRTGLATGPHLHFEVWRGGHPEDPLTWLREGPPAGDASD